MLVLVSLELSEVNIPNQIVFKRIVKLKFFSALLAIIYRVIQEELYNGNPNVTV
jgi:hypothetical protein